MILLALVIALLILLNAVFVAAEFSLVGAPRATVAQRSAEGDRLSARVHAVLRTHAGQDRFIATAQLGITLASLGLGMYGEHALAQRMGSHAGASVLAVALLTFLHILFGEIVPKSLALQRALSVSRFLALPMALMSFVFRPLIAALHAAGGVVLRLLRIHHGEHAGHTSEELETIVRESAEGGLIGAESAQILQELFGFGDLRAREVMVPRVKVFGIPARSGPEEVAQLMRESLHTRYPVYEDDLDHIIGVVHSKTLLRRLMRAEALAEQDVRPLPRVPDAASVVSVLQTMRAAQAQLAVVLDEYGGTAGIISIEDLFSEVVGDIGDSAPETWRDERGRLHTAGTTRLDTVGELLGRALEHPEVDTVGGLVLALLGRPPAAGDRVEHDGLRLEVVGIEGYGVRECLVEEMRSSPE